MKAQRKILFDVASLGSENLTGVGTATRELFLALQKQTQGQRLQIQPVLKLSRRRKIPFIQSHIEQAPRLYPPWIGWPKPDFDIFHGPDFKVPNSRRFPRVVTVHDLVEFHKQFNAPEFIEQAQHNMRELIQRHQPDLYIAVSEFTKTELEHFFPETKGKIQVVHHGADHLIKSIGNSTDQFSAKDEQTNPATEKFFLFVGTLERRKNIGRVIEAFKASGLEAQGYVLKVVGKKGFDAENELKGRNYPFVQFLNFVQQNELRTLYQAARGFLFPSFYEGFGFPILEAMASGTPVITSNIGACKETAGEAALFVDPSSIEALTEAMQALANSNELHTDLRAKGLTHSQTFQWQTTAKKTLEIYGELMKRSSSL